MKLWNEFTRFMVALSFILAAVLAFLIFAGCDFTERPPAENGEACSVDEDCLGDVCLLSISDEEVEFEGGLCTNDCHVFRPWECDWSEGCLIESVLNLNGWCNPRCYFDSECRSEDDYLCIQITPWSLKKYCLPDSLKQSWQTRELWDHDAMLAVQR